MTEIIAGLTPQEMYARLQALSARLEQCQVQLAGVSVVALGGLADPAKPGDYGWSVAYQDTLELRRKHQLLLLEVEENHEELERLRQEVATCKRLLAPAGMQILRRESD
jgi:hypothetical protein